jgi:hypothetical protein
VGGDHDFVGKPVVLCGTDDVFGGMENEALVDPFILLRHLIPQADPPAVPAAAGVGEVEHLVKVDVEVGFAEDAQVAVVVFLTGSLTVFPDITAVIWAFRVAMPRLSAGLIRFVYFTALHL